MTEILEGEIVEEAPSVTEGVTPKRKVRRDRKIRDKQFVAEYIANGGNATAAALKITNAKNRSSASVIGSNLLKRNEETIEQKMTKYGLTEELVYKKHKDLVNSDNEAIAMKAVDTFYKVTKKEGGKESDVTINFNW
jgi:hypothetical protein